VYSGEQIPRIHSSNRPRGRGIRPQGNELKHRNLIECGFIILSASPPHKIAELLPRQRGNVDIENRYLLEALIFRCKTGTPWRDMPQSYGKWHTIYTRITAGRKTGFSSGRMPLLRQRNRRLQRCSGWIRRRASRIPVLQRLAPAEQARDFPISHPNPRKHQRLQQSLQLVHKPCENPAGCLHWLGLAHVNAGDL